MTFQTLVDSPPIFGVLAAFVILALLVTEAGYRAGRWAQERAPDEREGPTPMIVGSLLALMAFLLSITVGMATDRFDTRRGFVLAEANAISTTYMRAGFLPEPASSEIRSLLREYVPLRIATDDPAALRAGIARSLELHSELWKRAEDLARSEPGSEVLTLFIESLNQVIDLHESRVTAGVYARVPPTILVLLILGSMLTLSMVGFNAGLTLRRSSLATIIMIGVLGAVITLIIDLDRPRGGFVQVSQQSLIDLRAQIGEP